MKLSNYTKKEPTPMTTLHGITLKAGIFLVTNNDKRIHIIDVGHKQLLCSCGANQDQWINISHLNKKHIKEIWTWNEGFFDSSTENRSPETIGTLIFRVPAKKRTVTMREVCADFGEDVLIAPEMEK